MCGHLKQGFLTVKIVLVKHLLMVIKGQIYDVSRSVCSCARARFLACFLGEVSGMVLMILRTENPQHVLNLVFV